MTRLGGATSHTFQRKFQDDPPLVPVCWHCFCGKHFGFCCQCGEANPVLLVVLANRTSSHPAVRAGLHA